MIANTLRAFDNRGVDRIIYPIGQFFKEGGEVERTFSGRVSVCSANQRVRYYYFTPPA